MLAINGCATDIERKDIIEGVLIESRSNGICPESLHGRVLVSEGKFRSRIPVPEHSITLDLWSIEAEENFIKGDGSGDYITDIDFFLAMPDSYWIGVISILATEGRANGICEYKLFVFKDGDKAAKSEILISGITKRVNDENISISDLSSLKGYLQTNNNDLEKLLGAIDSYSMNNAERQFLKLKF